MAGRGVPITLDRERVLRFDFNALVALETALGKPIDQAVAADHRISLRDIRTFIWAGLKHEDPALTLDGAGDLIQTGFELGITLNDLGEKLSDALAVSAQGSKEAAAAAVPPPPAVPAATG